MCLQWQYVPTLTVCTYLGTMYLHLQYVLTLAVCVIVLVFFRISNQRVMELEAQVEDLQEASQKVSGTLQ